MNVLLDTNVVLWIIMDKRGLSSAGRRLVDEALVVFVSAATVWEIGIKTALGKLAVDMDELLRQMDEAGFERLSVSWDHGRAVRDLPHYHRDPFDRLLIAQARNEALRLVTHDKALARYGDFVAVV